MSTLIQCEFCDIYVDFDDYLDHVRSCPENINSLASSIMSMLTFSISSENSLFNNLYQTDTEEENQENGDNDENDEEYYSADEDNNLPQQSNGNNIQIINNGNSITAIINLNGQRLRTIFDNDIMNIDRNLNNNIDELEDVKVPVKNIDIVAPIVDENELPQDIICTICQDTIISKSRKTLCNHYFCCKCIEPWLKELNKMCPNCFANLEDLEKELNKK